MIYKLAKIDRYGPCSAGAYILIVGDRNKQEVIITKYESAEKETNKMIENNGYEQETFYFLSGQERPPFMRTHLIWEPTSGPGTFNLGAGEVIIPGRTCRGPEAGNPYHPTFSTSLLKSSNALSTFTLSISQYILYIVATVILLSLFCYFKEEKNTSEACKFGSGLFSKIHLVPFCFLFSSSVLPSLCPVMPCHTLNLHTYMPHFLPGSLFFR